MNNHTCQSSFKTVQKSSVVVAEYFCELHKYFVQWITKIFKNTYQDYLPTRKYNYIFKQGIKLIEHYGFRYIKCAYGKY